MAVASAKIRYSMRPLPRQLDLPLQKIAELNAGGSKLLGHERGRRQTRKRVQLEEVDVIVVGCDHVGPRIAFTAEDRVRGKRQILSGFTHGIGDVRRADLARSGVEVFAGVVERAAGIDLNLDRWQREA